MKQGEKMRKLDENNNLQEMRIAGGYRSARAFAEVCGLNPNTYMNYEQGTVPIPLARAAKFAELLNCSIEEIAGIKVTCIIDDDSEELLLHNFRKLTPREKASLLIITQSMITAGGGGQ